MRGGAVKVHMASTKRHGLKTFWNRLLIKLRLREDWDNPLITPPAFENVKPHVYDPEFEGTKLTYCGQCGAGEKHQIHVKAHPFVPSPFPQAGGRCDRCTELPEHPMHWV
jgi:hypothetical protein